jgi:hypothetical protein
MNLLSFHHWKKFDPTFPVFTPIKTTGSKAMSFQLSIGGFMRRSE